MPTRTLSIHFDPAGLKELTAAQQRVAVAAPVDGATCWVAWQVFTPLLTSTMSWDVDWQVYASTSPLAAGDRLAVVARAAAVGGNTYPFAGGQFGAGESGLAAAQTGISNQDPDVTIGGVAMITGGLSLAANVDGTPHTLPVTADTILYRQRSVATFTDRFLVFAAGGIGAGSLLDPRWLDGPATAASYGVVIGAPLLVDLSTTTSQAIHYDSASNQFVPGATG